MAAHAATATRTPAPLLAAIGVAWVLAIAGTRPEPPARCTTTRSSRAAGSGRPASHVPRRIAAMVVAIRCRRAALVRLFDQASSGQPHPAAARVSFLGGYVLVWTAYGAAAFAFDGAVHATVDAWPWLGRHDWLIGAGLLAVAGAFSSRA